MKKIVGQKRFCKIKTFFDKNHISFYTNGYDINSNHLIISIDDESKKEEILKLVDNFLIDFDRISYDSINTFLKSGKNYKYVPKKRIF